MFWQLELIQTNLPWFFPTLFFVLGTCVGSFLNSCVSRISMDESIVKPRSHCACGQPIAWYDNIPILSWLILWGRARCCKRPFSIRYPLIEALAGGLFLLCWLLFPPAKAIAGMVFCAILIYAVFTDLDHMIIPDCVTVGGFLAGLTLAFSFPVLHDYTNGPYLLDSLRSFITAIVGGLVGSALVLWIGLLAEIILRREAMGFGDVKFMGAVGAFCGWQGAVFAIFGGAVIGTVGVILFLLLHLFLGRAKPPHTNGEKGSDREVTARNAPPLPDEESQPSIMLRGRQVPFGPMLATAGLLYFFYLHQPVDAYFIDISQLLFGMME